MKTNIQKPEKITIRVQKKITDLSLQEFTVLWKELAKKHSTHEQVQVDFGVYMYHLEIFLQYFKLKNVDDILKNIEMYDAIIPLVWVGVNHAIEHRKALKISAYNKAMELYKKHTEDNILLQNRVTRECEGVYSKIHDAFVYISKEAWLKRQSEIMELYTLPVEHVEVIGITLTEKLEKTMQFSMEECFQRQMLLALEEKRRIKCRRI